MTVSREAISIYNVRDGGRSFEVFERVAEPDNPIGEVRFVASPGFLDPREVFDKVSDQTVAMGVAAGLSVHFSSYDNVYRGGFSPDAARARLAAVVEHAKGETDQPTVVNAHSMAFGFTVDVLNDRPDLRLASGLVAVEPANLCPRHEKVSFLTVGGLVLPDVIRAARLSLRDARVRRATLKTGHNLALFAATAGPRAVVESARDILSRDVLDEAVALAALLKYVALLTGEDDHITPAAFVMQRLSDPKKIDFTGHHFPMKTDHVGFLSDDELAALVAEQNLAAAQAVLGLAA